MENTGIINDITRILNRKMGNFNDFTGRIIRKTGKIIESTGSLNAAREELEKLPVKSIRRWVIFVMLPI